jgi:hypothetical protein
MTSLCKEIEEASPLTAFYAVDENGILTESVDCSFWVDNQDDLICPWLEDKTVDNSQAVKTGFCPSPAKFLRFHHINSGKQLPVPCNKYSCHVCGPKKGKKLYAAVLTWLKQFKYIRMWTLTLSGSVVSDDIQHYKTLQEAWRRFITEIRRSKYLNYNQRNFQYVRVAELHLGNSQTSTSVTNIGKVHFHVFVTEYIEVKYLQSVWNHICQELTGNPCKNGNINIIGLKAHEEAAHYITKYVLKSAKVIQKNMKKWTKSGKTAIFEKFPPTGQWILINLCLPLEDQVCRSEPESFYTCKNIGTSSQSIESLPPPLCLFSSLEIVSSDKARKIFEAIYE